MSTQTEQTNQLTYNVGESALPVMKLLPQRLPDLNCAVLCTADGLNICSLQVNDKLVGKLSSLSSTLFSIGGSVIDTILDSEESQEKAKNKEVIIALDDMQVMAVEVVHPKLGKLVLLVAVKDTATGLMMMTLRNITEKLEVQFAA